MTWLKILALIALLIVVLTPAIEVRAQDSGPAKVGVSKRLTDEEIIQKAIELYRLSWRGSTGLAGAAGRLQRLVEENPDSRTTPLLRAVLEGMHEKQAAHSLLIAMFYLDKARSVRGGLKGGESRLREIVKRYPRYSRMDDVLYYLALIEYQSGERAEAIATLQRVVTEFAHSPRAKDASETLSMYRTSEEATCAGEIYDAKEVTRKAKITRMTEPRYTEEARAKGIRGTVVLSAVFCETGKVTNIEVVQSLPYGLTENAIETTRKIEFNPAEKNGKAVSQRFRRECSFLIY